MGLDVYVLFRKKTKYARIGNAAFVLERKKQVGMQMLDAQTPLIGKRSLLGCVCLTTVNGFFGLRRPYAPGGNGKPV